MNDKNMTYVGSQSVVFLSGYEADVELEYDASRDMFAVTADCDAWADRYRDFIEEYYPENVGRVEEAIKDAESDCREISGFYFTLREINRKLEQLCNKGDWFEFTWEYEDGTPVE